MAVMSNPDLLNIGTKFADEYRNNLCETLQAVDLTRVGEAAKLLDEARQRGSMVYVCGNGGSASTASHFVTDMLKGASYGRSTRFRIIALTDSLSTVSAYGNDVSFDSVFAEQLRNFAQPGDVFIAISGSGNSPNVVQAIDCAKAVGCHTIAMTGRGGGKLGPMADVEIRVSNQHMGRIEDVHMVVCHMLCYFFIDRPEN
jgi:D-sedoheptulose 7-phosphate isomerase